MRFRGRRSRQDLAALGALALLAVAAAPSAVAAPRLGAGSTATPPRIYAVISANGSGCVKPSQEKVTIASAAQKVLSPALAWQLTEGDGVKVAVLDTGFANTGSGQLAGAVTLGPDEVSQGHTGTDCVGHGTFVAGLIAARPAAGTTVVGIAPKAHIYAVAVTDSQGATSPAVLAAGITAAVNAGVKIIDVSVTSSQSSSALVKSIAYAKAHSVLVIAPNAADDQNVKGAVYPGSLPGVLSVGDTLNQSSTSSGTAGSATASSAPADLRAPGDAVLSVGPGGGAFIGSGAAYSAALVAGTAALMDAYHPGLSLAQRTNRLMTTAYPSTTDSSGTGGVVDPYAAVATILPDEYHSSANNVPAPTPVRPLPPSTASDGLRTGWAVVGVGLVVLLLALGVAVTVRRGRERHWRPEGIVDGVD